jgi:hypothetical protein
MSDYYFEYTNSVARLASAKYVIENMLRALKTENNIDVEVAKRLASGEIAEIEKILGE